MSTKNSNSSQLPTLIVILVLAIGGYFYTQKEEDKVQVQNDEPIQRLEGEANEQPVVSEESPYDENGALKDSQTQEKDQEQTEKLPPSDQIADHLKVERERQEEIKREFLNTMKAQFLMPENLSYTNLDLDEGVAGIHGVGEGDMKSYTALGTRMKINDQMVASYLNNSSSGLPFAGKVQFKSKPTMELAAPAGSGIGKVKIFESNNPGTKAALLPRSDGKGNYLFIMEANQSFYNSNEGYLEKMLQNFRTNGQ